MLSFLSLQVTDIIDFETLMTFGRAKRSLDLDFSGTTVNKGHFTLAVIQDEAPEDTGTEIKFDKEFESQAPTGADLYLKS